LLLCLLHNHFLIAFFDFRFRAQGGDLFIFCVRAVFRGVLFYLFLAEFLGNRLGIPFLFGCRRNYFRLMFYGCFIWFRKNSLFFLFLIRFFQGLVVSRLYLLVSKCFFFVKNLFFLLQRSLLVLRSFYLHLSGCSFFWISLTIILLRVFNGLLSVLRRYFRLFFFIDLCFSHQALYSLLIGSLL
jgi:hypothetical protein